MAIQLKNINHGFDVKLGDVGCTIRKGSKWGKYPINTSIELWECTKPHSGDCNSNNFCTLRGKGKIIGNWYGKLVNLPKSLLAMEHNIQARNWNTLIKMLEVGYGSISVDDYITALIYFRTS